MPKLKSIFTAPLLIVKIFRKSKIDNFIGGLLLGAIFSILVNIITVGIQETLHKQRVLEALENEIVSHAILASNVIKINGQEMKKNDLPNYFHITRVYSDRVWNNPESLQYIMELDPQVQSSLSSYYLAIVENINELNRRYTEFNTDKMKECYNIETKLTEVQTLNCKMANLNSLKSEVDSADMVFNHSMETLKKGFHPTQDRLSNPMLRLLMGSKSMNILSSER